MNLQQTLNLAQERGVALAITGDFQLSVKPKSQITPELREAFREHKGEIVCELMWHEYVECIGQDPRTLPAASPEMEETYGVPKAFAAALVKYDIARRYWDLIEEQAKNGREAAIVTQEGVIFLRAEPGGEWEEAG